MRYLTKDSIKEYNYHRPLEVLNNQPPDETKSKLKIN